MGNFNDKLSQTSVNEDGVRVSAELVRAAREAEAKPVMTAGGLDIDRSKKTDMSLDKGLDAKRYEALAKEIGDIGKPGKFILKPSCAKQMKVKVSEEIHDGHRVVAKRKCAIFVRGIVYPTSNPVYAANLRCNPGIQEVE